MMKVGVTGGIGSGKSTVCRLFAQKGMAVYDSDAAAKRLMQEDGALRRQLAGRFGEGTFRDGCGADQVVRRIAAQLDDDALSARADYVVVNIFEEDLEPAVVKLDRIFSHGSK